MLLTLSVVGRVDLTPADPLDARVAAAFNAHQRRATERGRLLGPDAVAAAVGGVRRRAAREVLVRPSPWRLGADEATLTAEWLAGWVGAAGEQEPELAAAIGPYARPAPGSRPQPAGSPSPSTTPTCWCCPHERAAR